MEKLISDKMDYLNFGGNSKIKKLLVPGGLKILNKLNWYLEIIIYSNEVTKWSSKGKK